MTAPYFEVWPKGWLFMETAHVIGLSEDAFCIDRRFHITVSHGLPGNPDLGWHLSIKPTCDHQSGDRVGADVWMPEVKRFFQEVKAWGYLGPMPSELGLDVFHFHENLMLREKRN